MSGPEKRNYGVSVERASSPRSQVAPGTACAPCTAKGHFCPAFEIVDSRAVCVCCLDGVPCMRTPRKGGVPQSPQPAEKTMPQPALAAGAEPSAVMPARRRFLQGAAQKQAADTAPALCGRGCGNPRHRGNCARIACDKAPAGWRCTRLGGHEGPCAAVKMRRSAGTRVENAEPAPEAGLSITEAQDIAKRILKQNVKVTTKVVEVVTAFPEASPMSSTKATDDPYEVVSRASVPGRVGFGVHDDTIRRLRELPEDQALKRTFSDSKAAHKYGDTVQKAASKRGIKVSFRCDEAALYIWLRSQ